MSVLDDFVRKRDLRKRAAEYERTAADPSLPTNVRTRFVLIANQTLVKYQRAIGTRLNKCSG